MVKIGDRPLKTHCAVELVFKKASLTALYVCCVQAETSGDIQSYWGKCRWSELSRQDDLCSMAYVLQT